MRASSSSTGLVMKAIVALSWLAVLLASLAALSWLAVLLASRAASDDKGAVSVAAARLAVQPRHAVYGTGRSWPEVVGMSAEDAKKKICEVWTCANVHVIPAGYSVTMELDLRRVRIFLDSNDKVHSIPMIG